MPNGILFINNCLNYALYIFVPIFMYKIDAMFRERALSSFGPNLTNTSNDESFQFTR